MGWISDNPLIRNRLMKKTLFILFAFIFLLACSRMEEDMPVVNVPETELEDDDDSAPTGYVRVNLGISLPELTPQTKALSELPTDLETIHVAVFGRSGYLKEYIQAEPVGGTAVTNGDKDDIEHDRYHFTVLLPVSENSQRRIHIIGNGPASLDYGQETDLLPNLLSPTDKGSYWQSFVVDGIKAARDPVTGKFLKDGIPQETGVGTFDPHPETIAYFQNIALIRNFAQIVIDEIHSSNPEEECNFTTKSFAGVNVAREGAVVPYYSGGFLYNYQDKSYQDLLDLGYPALLPLDATIDSNIPEPSAFENPASSAKVSAKGEPFFMYERPVPNDAQPPTVVIIYGTFKDPDTGTETNCYYKIDLMENSQYYPLFRNFRYHIIIKKILTLGASTPEGAMYSMGSGDISSDIATQTLTDISDGTSRILVSYMNKTLIRQYSYDDPVEELTLFYKYIPDVNDIPTGSDEPRYNNNLASVGGPVSVALQGSVADPVLTNFKVANADEDGWRRITFETSAPSANMRTQYIQITGTPAGGERPPLFRRVTYSMINTQTMQVTCVPHKVESFSGEEMRVDITIPKNLPSGMFPLKFKLESTKLSITPDNSQPNNNLPVLSGNSMVPDSDNVAFYYVRTLSETEYKNLSRTSQGNTVTIPCYFLTNMAQSASTIYVEDEGGYFYQAHDNFTNFRIKDFTNLNYVNGVPTTNATGAMFQFNMDNTDPLPEIVYLRFTGAAPASGSGLTKITNSEDPYYNWYWYSPAETTNNNLKEGNGYQPRINYATDATNLGTGEVKIEIRADEYNGAEHEHKLTAFSVTPASSTVMGKGETVRTTSTLTYNNAPTSVTLPLASGSPAAVINWTSDNESIATVDANGVITTTGYGTTTIRAQVGRSTFTGTTSITVNGPQFTNAGFYSAVTTTNGTATNGLSIGNNRPVYFAFNYATSQTGPGYPVTVTLTNLAPADDETRLVSNGDGTYTFTPANNNRWQYFQLKSSTRYSSGTVQITNSDYMPLAPVTINRSLFIPSRTLIAKGYGNNNPTHITTNNNNNNGTAITMSASQGGASLASVYFRNDYSNRTDIEIAAANLSSAFPSPVDGTLVHFQYTYNNNTYHDSLTLGEFASLAEGTVSSLTLHLYRWASNGSYSIDLSTNANYNKASFTDGTSGITVNFDNYCSGQNTVGYRRKRIGTNNHEGTISISASSSSLAGCKITGVSVTYYNGIMSGNHNECNVFVDRLDDSTTDNLGAGATSWASPHTGDGNGNASLAVRMAGGQKPNELTNLTVTYGYWDY
jgi:hypothetical protein